MNEAMDVNKNALLFLKSRHESISIVDVGCARGALLQYTKRMFDQIFSIGIDPLNHANERPQYTHFLQCAIDDVKDKEVVAKFYINRDDQASSLLQMDFANISNDLNTRDEKYYIRWSDHLGILGEVDVPVISLKSVLDRLFPSGDIHLLKIDAEGKDLDVIKSLEEHSHRPHFVSLECSSHKNDKIRIFKNGCHINEVVPYMESIGYHIFEKFDCEDDPNNLTQMCDIVFIRKDLNEG